MNSVILTGRLARDPELSYTPNTQMAVCRFTLAVDRPGKDKGADFIRVTVWDKQAVNCDRYLAKGRQAAVMGRIQTGSYKDRSGQTVYTTDVVADRVEFLGGAQGENSRSEGSYSQNGMNGWQGESAPQTANNQVGFGFSQTDDGVPF